jgi:hypothetical protein
MSSNLSSRVGLSSGIGSSLEWYLVVLNPDSGEDLWVMGTDFQVLLLGPALSIRIIGDLVA